MFDENFIESTMAVLRLCNVSWKNQTFFFLLLLLLLLLLLFLSFLPSFSKTNLSLHIAQPDWICRKAQSKCADCRCRSLAHACTYDATKMFYVYFICVYFVWFYSLFLFCFVFLLFTILPFPIAGRRRYYEVKAHWRSCACHGEPPSSAQQREAAVLGVRRKQRQAKSDYFLFHLFFFFLFLVLFVTHLTLRQPISWTLFERASSTKWSSSATR